MLHFGCNTQSIYFTAYGVLKIYYLKIAFFFQFLAVYTDSFLACILHFDFVSYNDITPQNYSIVTLLEKEKLL